MLEIQAQLNNTIEKTQGLSRSQTRVQSHLCIMVELMELCNATRCFNYWSAKQRASDDAILEEFADVLCFLLTELLEINLTNVEVDTSIKAEDRLNLTNRFQNLCELYNNLDVTNPHSYFAFSSAFLNLGYALGYDMDAIFAAYEKKVQKNYLVQQQFASKG